MILALLHPKGVGKTPPPSPSPGSQLFPGCSAPEAPQQEAPERTRRADHVVIDG